MSFVDHWRAQLTEVLSEAVRLALLTPEIDLKFELMVVGMLWPIRRPVQDFEVEALGAVQQIVANRAVPVLKMVQQWDDSMLDAARQLAAQSPRSRELDAGLQKLIGHLGVFPIFARQLAKSVAQPRPAPPPAAALPAAPRVYIAYNPLDGAELAAEVRQKLTEAGISLWPDLEPQQGQRDWWANVTQAIEQVSFLVLIMTPAATQSNLVRRQWRHASQHGTCIFPLTQADNLNFSLLPRWIRQVHFFNLQLEWPKLLTALNGACQTPRVPFMADDLPADFTDRPAELGQIKAMLFDAQREEAIPGVAALYGAGGYGKSTLAKAVCHTDDIRQVFDSGILWVTLGENPGELSRYVIDLIETLCGERPGFSGLDAAVVRLSELLADRQLLLVIDDVWHAAHLKPFLQGGPNCARLITTRNINTLPFDARIIEINAMRPAEALALLRYQLPVGNSIGLQQLAGRLGGWPLLLKLTNGTLRDQAQKHKQQLTQAIEYVNQAFDQHGLVALDRQNASSLDLAVSQTMEISLERLDAAERARFNELAIFPEDSDIPLATLETLWAAAGLDDFDTEELCDRLHALSLLSKFDLTSRHVRLHKVMRSYLVYQRADELPSIHNRLLNACLAPLGWWNKLPATEPYLWQHLAFHLLQAGRGDELVQTALDLRYLAAKILVKGAHYAESDLKMAQTVAPDNAALKAMSRLISQAGHLLVRAATPADAFTTLHSRMVNVPQLAQVANATILPVPALTARHPLPNLPDPQLIRTLWGHTAGVLDCALSADGSTIVSVDKDNAVLVWRTATGESILKIAPTGGAVWSCAVNADGSTAALGSTTGQLTILNTAQEQIERDWPAHEAAIVSCCINADASVVVTASKDKTLKVWEAATGALRLTLAGHERTVTGCDISADGGVIASASNDGLVKIWDGRTGAELRTLVVGITETAVDRLTFYSQRDISFSCALSADGATVAAGASAGILNVWPVAGGPPKFSCLADKRGIYKVAINADGSRVVTALGNGALKVWDNAGQLLLNLVDHDRVANSCAISADGLRIVSVSDDKTVKVWEGSHTSANQAAVAYKIPAESCAISADGQLAVTALADNSLKVWQVETATPLATLSGHTRKINGCAINADGQWVASASQDQTVVVWNARTGQAERALLGHTWAASGCAITADGQLALSASEDCTLKVWNTATGDNLFTLSGHTRAVKSCAVNGHGTLAVSASGDGTLRLWNPLTGEFLTELKGHRALVNTCAISADGRTAVSASLDKTLKIWDTATAAERFTLAGHSASVTGCALSADGGLAVSVSRDKSLKVWNARTGACLATLFVDEPLLDCACSASAADIVAVSGSGVYFLRLVQ